MSQPRLSERLGIAGSGAIATGLARTAAPFGDVVLWARSDDSADRAQGRVDDGVRVVTDLGELDGSTMIVEAIVEDPEAKAEMLQRLHDLAHEDTVIASTTSSLSISELADASGRPERVVGLHVFNPVEKMKLVELAFPNAASEDTRRRARAFCDELGKTPVEVPDTPGFVVNRLLFPYLFDAVRLMDETGLEPEAIDECMKLGAGHPMGPLALLDFVGVDVSIAIGESIGADVPQRLRDLAAEGRLGRKSGAGLYDYPPR
ncbi:MAG TPA: 3-hydroxyacyl-CoA dehydrogenase family protein [Thermoleophilaceae bacterium]